MTSVRLDTATLFGTMRPYSGKAPFSVTWPVFRLESGQVLEAVRFPSSDTVEGYIIDPGDWEELVETHEACALPEPISVSIPSLVWFLSRTQDDEWRMDALDLLLDMRATERWDRVGDVLVIVVDRSMSALARERLAPRCDHLVAEACAAGDWARAATLAERAFLIEPAPTARRCGALIRCLRSAGRIEDADSWLAFMGNSWGSTFANEVEFEAGRG